MTLYIIFQPWHINRLHIVLNLDPEAVSFISRPNSISQEVPERGRLAIKQAHQSALPGMWPHSARSSALNNKATHKWPLCFLIGCCGSFPTSLCPTLGLLCQIVKDIQNMGLLTQPHFATIFQFSLKRVISQQCYGNSTLIPTGLGYCCLLQVPPLPYVS